MKLTSHIAISFSVSLGLYLIFHSYLLALSSFIYGIFIDLDHFFEYFKECGFNLNVKKFFQLGENYGFKKTFLFLHSWEIFLLFSAVVFVSSVSEILFGVFIGYAFHLIFDQFGNLSKPLSYFFIYRWKNDFLTEKIWRIG
ncbi:MAG: hypothetical protein COS68_03135 [Elusimicrobia bacterium CG06_land_8_20_14_3_00_38_11]|nr:MAG: hypothetical protein COS68_03135 [Elusimicrobia bacterium CG06_land_8_20_14_3_00_38_11]